MRPWSLVAGDVGVAHAATPYLAEVVSPGRLGAEIECERCTDTARHEI